MNIILTLTVLVAAIANVHAVQPVSGTIKIVETVFKKIANSVTKSRSVIVENQSGQPVRLWCASKNDRIARNGLDYIDLKDQEAMGWSFRTNFLPGLSGDTLFWCTFCYRSQKRGWKVYDEKWESLKNGVPSDGILPWHIIDDSVRWDNDPLQKGWDFASWKSDGSC